MLSSLMVTNLKLLDGYVMVPESTATKNVYKKGYHVTEATETYRPKSSLLIDANTGDILWQDNIDEVRDPASSCCQFTLST